MARSAESTTEANASASDTVAAAGDWDAVGEGAAMPSAVRTRLIKQVELLLRESGIIEPFDAAVWVERWLRRPNHALGGAAPELFLHTPQGETLLANLIGAMAAGSYM
jgi:uncharacterized protein (DUF2384 family)